MVFGLKISYLVSNNIQIRIRIFVLVIIYLCQSNAYELIIQTEILIVKQCQIKSSQSYLKLKKKYYIKDWLKQKKIIKVAQQIKLEFRLNNQFIDFQGQNYYILNNNKRKIIIIQGFVVMNTDSFSQNLKSQSFFLQFKRIRNDGGHQNQQILNQIRIHHSSFIFEYSFQLLYLN
ncbi:hypothetical protein pb186bvf_006447 [Paramecium bursaria]